MKCSFCILLYFFVLIFVLIERHVLVVCQIGVKHLKSDILKGYIFGVGRGVNFSMMEESCTTGEVRNYDRFNSIYKIHSAKMNLGGFQTQQQLYEIAIKMSSLNLTDIETGTIFTPCGFNQPFTGAKIAVGLRHR